MLVDLSGSNAATSSIFLNCHGNRDGYKNGRMSKPASHVHFKNRATRQDNIRLSSGLYASYAFQTVRKKKRESKETPHRGVQRDMTV